MKTFAFIFSTLAVSVSAFAPSSSFSGSAMKAGVTSDSALSMAMERSYIMVSYHLLEKMKDYNLFKTAVQ